MGPQNTTTYGKEPSSTVQYNGKDYEIVKEGLAEILNQLNKTTPEANKAGKDGEMKPQAVFYNPIQQFNRDLSVLAIKAFSEESSVIRRARHERRLQKTTQHGGKGTKRKREDGDETQEVKEAPQHQESKRVNGYHQDQLAPVVLSEPAKEGLSESATSVGQDAATSAMDSGVEASAGSPKINGDQLGGSKPTDPAAQEVTDEIANNGGMPVVSEQSDAASTSKEVPNKESVTDDYAPKPSFTILDALSATGLRALRYAKEIPLATSVTANDLSHSATASIKLNVQHNGLSDKIKAISGNALTHMYSVATSSRSARYHAEKYNVIDLDPYGTAAPFFDASVQALQDGGLLCVTCTDAGVFASAGYLEKTYSLYGGLPFKGPQSHEGGLRLILHAIATSAARYGLAIEPLLSLSIDFYARIFVRVRNSPAEVKFLAGKTMVVYNCDEGCGAWTTQLIAQNRLKKDKNDNLFYKHQFAQALSTSELCEHCGSKTHLAGPMWAGPLHNPHFVERILDTLPSLDSKTYATIPRLEGMLSLALNETLLDPSDQVAPSAARPEDSLAAIPRLDIAVPDYHPFFIIPSVLAKVLHCISPSDAELRGALKHCGYRTTRSHTKAGSIRTDAPWTAIWEIMREWVRQKAPVKESAIKKGSAGWGIMQKSRSSAAAQALKVDLSSLLGKNGDLESLKTEIEAALYRAGRVEEAPLNNKDGEEDTDMAHANEERGLVKPERAGSVSQPISKLKVIFDEKLGKEPEGRRLVRYQTNPRANWGPMNRAKGGHE
ncbi:tRNA methyltransferase, Trm1 [Lasallia pustulata]|uniref:tRNA (guanine(26)-N(2))-dimethyltransferase n=1 Tax=Lasallia pustulata TaxID=136370 RepID=A0A1W5CYY8_9LECA|nr:tRNA methyltransferase, Trm1 [Lasallia pustulata]